MHLYLTKRFQKRFEELPKEIQGKTEEAIWAIEQNPYTGKKLSGALEGHYSWRLGHYRILYTVQGQNIFAETVKHRKEVYR